MSPALFKEFAAGFTAEQTSIVAAQNRQFADARIELGKVKSKQRILLDALAEGMPARSFKDEMIILETREDDLNARLAKQPKSEPALLPELAELYHEKVAALAAAVVDPAYKNEAFGIIRTLIDEVRLIPEDSKLRVELRGALAGIFSLAMDTSRPGQQTSDNSVSVLVEQVKLVAGARFERAAFRL